MSKEKIYIYGSGGHGKVVLDILLESGREVAGFLDDNAERKGQKVGAFEIFGNLDQLTGNKDSTLIALGIGNNKIRERIYKKAKAKGIKVVSAIHPKAIVSRDVQVADGVTIMPGAIVNPGVVIDAGAVINTRASVDHDCQLGAFCQIWPGAVLAGTVRVGRLSYVGTGASVIQNINIGKEVMLGAGAVLLNDLADGVTAVGVPAKVIKNAK
ncbi:MAG: acetyltransferase [Candidatus Margulisiibacteriota bacterium]|nr:acetyltransferase [Candidatus Margulisiibacteriota bacterium]